MARLFASLDPELLRTNTPDVIANMMDMIRKHQVHLKGVVSTVVVSECVVHSSGEWWPHFSAAVGRVVRGLAAWDALCAPCCCAPNPTPDLPGHPPPSTPLPHARTHAPSLTHHTLPLSRHPPPSPLQITTMVLEGWSTKLNPDIRVMDTLKDILPQNWGIRIGKTIDRCCSSGALALAAI